MAGGTPYRVLASQSKAKNPVRYGFICWWITESLGSHFRTVVFRPRPVGTQGTAAGLIRANRDLMARLR